MMSVEEADRKFVSNLDAKSREVAKKELNELNEKDRETAVQTLRQWALEQTWLKTPTDFEFLLRFLRVRKFSQLEARKSLENYWTSKTLYPHWFRDVDPANEEILTVLKSGFVYSPKKYDKFGRRVLISPAGALSSALIKKCGADAIIKTMVCILDWLSLDENVQVNGLVSLYDHTDMDYMLMAKVWTPTMAKSYMHFFQKAVPIRFKAFAIYNESSLLDLLMSVFRPFMTEKVQSRIKVYGHSMVQLHDEWGKESFPRDYLPDEYTGPCMGTKSECIDDMIKEMMDPKFRNYIKSLSSGNYGVDKKARKLDTDTEVASFRKLNID